MRKRFLRRVLIRLVIELKEGAKNAAYVVNHP